MIAESYSSWPNHYNLKVRCRREESVRESREGWGTAGELTLRIDRRLPIRRGKLG